MKLRAKTTLLLVSAGVFPILVEGLLSSRANRVELQKSAIEANVALGAQFAVSCRRFVVDAVDSLKLATSYLLIDELSTQELAAGLRIPFRQLRFVTVLTVVDSHGAGRIAPLFDARSGENAQAVDQHLEAFSHHIPLEAAFRDGQAVGPPYRTKQGPCIAVAVRVNHDNALVAEVSLSDLEKQGAALATNARHLELTTESGLALFSSHDSLALVSKELFVKSPPASASVLDSAGGRWLVSVVDVQPLHWRVMVAESEGSAFLLAGRLQRYSFFWAAIALAMTGALGVILSGALVRPVVDLTRAASALAAGITHQPVSVQSADELGVLAHSFNHMLEQVARRDAEIRQWNAELQNRVDDRTAELKRAQEQILRSRRLTALASMAAGMAHELNNPLTAVMGLITLTRAELTGHPADGLLSTALEQTRRIAEIVRMLRTIADQEPSAGSQFSLRRPIEAALAQNARRIADKQIRLQLTLDEPLPAVQGDPAQIQSLMGHLIQNAVTAMSSGGSLRVAVSHLEGNALQIGVGDTGHGIRSEIRDRIFDPFFTTKVDGPRAGLGLTLAHSIVEAHHGQISVESIDGAGSTFTVILPAAPAGTHLV